MNDQDRFTPNCIKYILGISSVSLNIIYEDIPISIYKIVHTTGNIHDGIKLSMLELGTVIRPTIVPRIRGNKINNIGSLYFFINYPFKKKKYSILLYNSL